MSAASGPPGPALCLGTAQIGEPYGLSAIAHDDGSAMRLLDAAFAAGIRRLDTAAAYGEAERRIGAWRARHPVGAAATHLFSKLPPVDATPMARDGALAALERSRARLGAVRLAGYMAHRARDAARRDVRSALLACREAGLAERIGASVYTAEEAMAVLAAGGYDFLQVPLSLFNLEARTRGVLEAAAGAGIAVHARSLFVQGLLLRDATDLPAHLAAAAPVLRRLDDSLREIGVSRAAMALAAVGRMAGVSMLVVGADSAGQIDALVAAAASAATIPIEAIEAAEAIAATLPAGLADPRSWPRPSTREQRSHAS